MPETEAEDAEYSTDDDPRDDVSVDAPGLGIVVRTDFADEGAWQAFYEKLQAAEAEFSSGPDEAMGAEAPAEAGSSSNDNDAEMDEDVPEDAELDEGNSAPIFTVINPSDAAQRQLLEGISSLAALRLFNDVDIRPAPPLPAGEKRIKPPNRLVDYHGWQEVYTGKMLWIYDAKSNADQCVRLVGQQSAMYGTAT